MKTSFKKVTTALTFASTLLPVTGMAIAGNIRSVSFSEKSEPVTIEVTDRKSHLVDFSNSDADVTGIFVDDATEFSKSFKIDPVPNNPQMLTITGVPGGSSKFTANIIRQDTEGKQYIQPINLVKRWSANTITRISDNNSIAEEKSNNAEVAALERGYQVASQNPNFPPDLKARMGELVEATKNGEDLYQAADEIVVSEPIVQQLIAMGTTK
jgi:hypothetical protein